MLSQDEFIERATLAYIYENEDVASIMHVKAHLEKCDLIFKDTEQLKDGTLVLGLQDCRDCNKLHWIQVARYPQGLYFFFVL